jgi:hypothetical protein
MSLEQKQIPESSHLFDNDNRTDNEPDYKVITGANIWHLEPILICLLPLYYYHSGKDNRTIPLWRMNGAGPNDPKTPVILSHGLLSNRYSVDYGIEEEKYSLARFIANRGRDVWIIEFEQATEKSSFNYLQYLVTHELPWISWYTILLFTEDLEQYTNTQAYFDAQDICTTQTAIVGTDQSFTATGDDLIFHDIPAFISTVQHFSGQSKIQWVGHSLGGTLIYGFMPTQFSYQGKTNAGWIENYGWNHLLANSILSFTALCVPTALFDCPQWLTDLANSGQLNLAYKHRGKLARYYTYLNQPLPRWPIKFWSVVDTALMKQVEIAFTNQRLSFFNTTEHPQQYYDLLYDGQTLPYAWPAWNQMWVYGRPVTIPTTAIYDGNGYDDLATKTNTTYLFNKLTGYKCLKPFFQFSHAPTVHNEMIWGYNVEDGIPDWPKDLNYQPEGTYHYIWYDLNRYLPPAQFSAYITDITCSGSPLVSWHNLRDAVSYEIWAKQNGGSFSRKVAGVSSVCSASTISGLSSGAWLIKIRAFSLGGSWQDHSGLSSIGGSDDQGLFLSVNIT